MNKLELLLIYFRPKILAIFFLGIASGVPLSLTASTLSVWLTEVGVEKQTIGIFSALAIPYTLKFIWSPLIDHIELPILHYLLGKRRSWIVLSQIALIGSIIMLGFTNPEEDYVVTFWIGVMVAFFSATQDIVIDAYRVEVLKKEEQGAGAAMIVFGYRIGMLFSSAGALFMAELYDWSVVYTICALLIFIGMVTVLATGEPKIKMDNRKEIYERRLKNISYIYYLFSKMVVQPLKDFIKRKNWYIILLFVLFFKFGDALAGSMTNTFLIETGFSKSEIATIVKTYGFFATMAGSFLGGALVFRVGLVRSLWIAAFLQMFSNLMLAIQAIIGYNTDFLALAIGIENLTSGIGNACFVAYLSSLCNLSYTATQYAILSSIASAGRSILSTPSGYLADMFGWVNFFLLTTIAAIPGIILLKIVIDRMKKINSTV